MELKEFIKTTLISIVEAVEETKNTITDKDSICPFVQIERAKEYNLDFNNIDGRYYQKINFDIAVTAATQTEDGGKAGIKVLGIEASIGGNSSFDNSTVSRIKFNVPIGLSCKNNSKKGG